MSHPVDVEETTFAQHTTLRIGGPVESWVIARTEDACIEAIVECDDLGRELLVVGGGSNLVCADSPFDGTVVQVACAGESIEEIDGFLHVTVGAGEEWDAVVVRLLECGSGSLAPLSGIPGLVGATPIQNVGAYGVEVGSVIDRVRVWDRLNRSIRTLGAQECGFAYRSSVFKSQPSRFVVLGVTFALPLDEGVVVSYEQLAHELDVPLGALVDGRVVRDAVLRLRRGKGMVLDENDHDTWSVGSFFVNPIVEASVVANLPEECPRYSSEVGIKLSAAWLIESCDVTKGFSLPGSAAHVSGKHTLALCNYGSATCNEIIDLARDIRSRVQQRYGIELQVEPRLVGVSL